MRNTKSLPRPTPRGKGKRPVRTTDDPNHEPREPHGSDFRKFGFLEVLNRV